MADFEYVVEYLKENSKSPYLPSGRLESPAKSLENQIPLNPPFTKGDSEKESPNPPPQGGL